MTRLVVAGTPVPKGRPRTTFKNGTAVTYTPQRTRDYEETIRWAARLAHVRPIDGPVCVTVRFYGANRGDLDNCGKACLDALNGYGFNDDAQVEELHIYLTRKDERPRTEIEVVPLEHGVVSG